ERVAAHRGWLEAYRGKPDQRVSITPEELQIALATLAPWLPRGPGLTERTPSATSAAIRARSSGRRTLVGATRSTMPSHPERTTSATSAPAIQATGLTGLSALG